ncbi:Hypothetical predicted protein [Lecanosticta acicola]|uniref:Uncharacterized protein n=1 Tax=Lecanosticta acicola TaxID=111012 RepID=A0AAI8Z0P6_9PEZI|nr:Hypothetical predicted protein [Lecanosticta acicola]
MSQAKAAANKAAKKPAAPVAQADDWDSDESSAVPGTTVLAQRSEPPPQPSPRPAKTADSRRRPDASSRGKAAAPEPTLPASQRVVQRPASGSPIKPKSKPVIHRNDSGRDPRAHTVSSATGRQPATQCDDPNCRDPGCLPTRRSTVSYHQPQPAPYATHYAQYPNGAMPPPIASMMMPPPPRPRAGSTSRGARPVSIHGYSGLSYSGAQPGPPPSASAYYGYPQPYAAPQAAGYYGSTPSTQALDYPPASPVVPPSPTSPNMTTYPGFPGYAGGMSARAMAPNVAGLEMPKAVQPPGIARTMSARRTNERRDSRLLELEPPAADSESVTSDSSEYESEPERHRRRRSSARDSRPREQMTVVRHPKRPSVSQKYYTESSVPTTSQMRREPSRPREPLRRAPRSDNYYEYPSSPGVNDSDPTQRAMIPRRGTTSSSHSSRRPSVSTTASSGRTKNTSLTSNTDYSSDYSKVILEGPNGRRTAYLSKDQQAALSRRARQQQMDDRYAEAQRLQEERVSAYQRAMSGGELHELTAENIKKSQYRKSASHVSGRSQKSSGSGSQASKADGIKIQLGDTVLHVYGDAKVEMRPGEDGRPAHFFIASSSGRDSAYTASSKSSGSRMGRSRARGDMSKRERIPENEYEEPL